MSTRLIINPTAGGGRCLQRLRPQLERLRTRWPRLEVCASRSATHLTDLAADAAALGYDRVLVAGGDGAVHFAANGLAGSQTALGIIPLGSGNDVARSVGLPTDARQAVEVLIEDHAIAMDLGRAANRVFCCVLGVGMDTPALHRIYRSRLLRRGKLLYTSATIRTLLTYQPEVLDVVADGRLLSHGPTVFAAVTNTRTYAGGMVISPDADVEDGELDLCAFGAQPLPSLLRTFGAVLEGKHAHRRGVVTARVRQVVLSTPEPRPVTLDGELTDLVTDLTVEVWPGALQVLGRPRAWAEVLAPRRAA